MNMSRIENYNEEQQLYLLHCIRGVVNTVENPRKDTTTELRRKAVWDNQHIANIIVACAVLHNLAIDWDEPRFPQPTGLELADFNTSAGPDAAYLPGSAFRQVIFSNHFS